MKIGDPAEFLAKLDMADMDKLQREFDRIKRFLKPGDTFQFQCSMMGDCCKDRIDNPIILSPYDVARLRRNLSVTTGVFLRRYAETFLGNRSQYPIALLRYRQTSKGHDRCPFLRGPRCSVHPDRPLRCRLYPLGRAWCPDGTSYYFLMDTPDYCGVGKGREYTVDKWLKETKAVPYLEWSNRFFEALLKIDYARFRSLDGRVKQGLGLIMYDFDDLIEKLVESQIISQPLDDNHSMSLVLKAVEIFLQKSLVAR